MEIMDKELLMVLKHRLACIYEASFLFPLLFLCSLRSQICCADIGRNSLCLLVCLLICPSLFPFVSPYVPL